MDVAVLKEYLVRLGVKVDQPQLTKFQQTLDNVGHQVEQHAEGIAKAFATMGATIASAYAAIGTATLALADKVSQAELGFQLYSQRMYVTTDAGKKLSIAMDALGHSLDEIAWNPELQERFHQLIEDQKTLQEGLGPEYQERMRQIRDLRFEITRAWVGVQYLGMALVNNLVKAFGLDDGKLRGWVNWFIENVPVLAQKIATYLVPILKDAYVVLKSLFDIGSSFASGLATVIEAAWKLVAGFLGYDTSKIDSQSNALEKFAVTIDQISNAVARLAALADRHKTVTGILLGALFGGSAGAALGLMGGGPEGMLAGLLGGAGIGAAAGGTLGYLGSRNDGSVNGGSLPPATDAADHARELAKRVSSQTGIPADWIFAQWAHETDFFRSRAFREQNNLAGMREGMQYRTFGSMDESAQYFAKLLSSPRYSSAHDANSMEAYALALKRGGYYEDTYANYSRGMARWEPQYSRGDVNVGGVQVYVTHPGASAEEIGHHVVRAIDQRLGAGTQRLLAESAGPYR